MKVSDKYESKEAFARECRDTKPEYFEHKIRNCENKAWLREAVSVEAEGESRTKRIAFMNKKISEL